MGKDKGILNANAIGINYHEDTIFIALFDQSPRDNSSATVKASIALNVETVKGLIKSLSEVVDIIESVHNELTLVESDQYIDTGVTPIGCNHDMDNNYIQPLTNIPFKQ